VARWTCLYPTTCFGFQLHIVAHGLHISGAWLATFISRCDLFPKFVVLIQNSLSTVTYI
jgi:hypothetical protein